MQSNLTMVESASTLVSGRLSAFDKCPFVRPIGIGECLRKINCKSVAECTKIDLEETTSTDQLACGLQFSATLKKDC